MNHILGFVFVHFVAISCANVSPYRETSLSTKSQAGPCRTFIVDGREYWQGQQKVGEGVFGVVYPLMPTHRGGSGENEYVVKVFKRKNPINASDLEIYSALPSLVPKTIPGDSGYVVKQRVNGWSLERMRKASGVFGVVIDREFSEIKHHRKNAEIELEKFVAYLAAELQRLAKEGKYLADLYPRNIMWDKVKGKWFVVDAIYFENVGDWKSYLFTEAKHPDNASVYYASVSLRPDRPLEPFIAYVKAHLDEK